MTKEEVIKILQGAIKKPITKDGYLGQALDMAIKALEQEPCEDSVSRKDALKAIDTWDKFGYTETGCFVREPKGDYVPYVYYDDIVSCIKNLPPVTPQPETGYWIINKDLGYYVSTCSNCNWRGHGNTVLIYKPNYCPNCGAKMIERRSKE